VKLPLRPLSTSEILDRTFSLYRNNFFLLIGIALLPAALGLVLHVIGVAAHITVPARGRPLAETQILSVGYEALIIFIAAVIGGGIASGATVCAVYSMHAGKPATIAGSYKKVLGSWARVIAAAIMVFLIVLLVSSLATLGLIFGVFVPLTKMQINSELGGMLAALAVLAMILGLAILWLYLTAWLCFVIPALLLDKLSFFRSFRRSHALSRGSRGRLLLMFVLTYVLILAFDWTLRLPGYMLFAWPRQPIPLELWTDAASFLARVFAGPIATISIALFYIDQRIRREAFDLQLMIESIQENSQAVATELPNARPAVV
jgi:hypothetical protein